MATARPADGLVLGDLTREIIGAFFEVYNSLGYGFLESVYQRALPVALKTRGIDSRSEVPVHVQFGGQSVGDFRIDLVVADRVIVETKAVEKIVQPHEAQVLTYLKASGLPVGLVLNFGPRATFRRLVLTPRPEGSTTIHR